MDFTSHFNKNSVLILLLAILGFSSANTLAKTNTPPIAKSVWEKSYAFEYQKKYAEAANVLKPILANSPTDELTLIRLRLAKLPSRKI